MRHLRLALTTIALASAPEVAAAQRIAGVVVDSAGRFIVDADVIVGSGIRARTDSTGAFSIGLRERGRQALRVRYIGFRPFETTVDPARPQSQSLRITLVRMPQLLAEVRITDINSCERNTLKGFECRRNSGQGIFRDAGEIRSLRPSAWADMFDGIPSLRRVPMMTPDGLDWRPGAPPSTCLTTIFNGEDPNFDGHVRKVGFLELVTQDVVAIEYYDSYRKVPLHFRRFAEAGYAFDVNAAPTSAPTPMRSGAGCALIVYWIREAPARSRTRRGARSGPVTIQRPPT